MKKIHNLIRNNLVIEAIKEMNSNFLEDDKEFDKTIILESQYQSNKKNFSLGLISITEKEVVENRIKFALLELARNTSETENHEADTLQKEVIERSTSCRIDYSFLEQKLKEENWKKANEETTIILIKISGREMFGPLDCPGALFTLGDRDIESLPCDDLLMIDKLWSKYSNNRFGFSSQIKVYETIIKTREIDWEEYCNIVGWHTGKIYYKLQSPIGHLPTPPLHYIHGLGEDYIKNIDEVKWWNIATIINRFSVCMM